MLIGVGRLQDVVYQCSFIVGSSVAHAASSTKDAHLMPSAFMPCFLFSSQTNSTFE